MSPRRVALCPAEELKVGDARRFEVEGAKICLVRCTDAVRAVHDVCSHEDYSLSEGEVDAESCEIECWKHGSLFSLVTGAPLTLPATRPVAVYPVEVADGQIVVELP